MVKHMGDGTLGADFGFGFGKAATNIPKSTVRVVGETLNDHHGIARGIAFIASHRIVFATAAPCFFNRFLNHMSRYLGFFSAFNQVC